MNHVDRLKDYPTKRGVSLALGGGGVRGICCIGVFRALEEAGIPIGSLTGISAGAIASSMYAFEPDAERVAEKTTRHLLSQAFAGSDVETYMCMVNDHSDHFSSLWDSMRKALALGSLLRSPSLLSAESHRKFLADLIPEIRIEQAAIPLAIVALDIISGAEVCLREGDLRRAVAASTAITGLFPPVEWNGYRLVDNGLMLPVPIAAARRWTPGPLVAVDVSASHVPSTPQDNGLTLLWRMQQSQARVIRNSTLREADLVLRPDVSLVRLPLTEEVIADCVLEGERVATAALPAIRRLLLSPEDCLMLDIALRHRLLKPRQAAAATARAIERPSRELAGLLAETLGQPAFGLIRELAAQVLDEESCGQVARALGEAISAEEIS